MSTRLKHEWELALRDPAWWAVSFLAVVLWVFALTTLLHTPSPRPNVILVCSSPVGETVPGGKGYRHVWFEDGAWKMEDEKRNVTTYTPIPGEMCRVEPLEIVEEN
jgi:hypothetical protein